MLAYLYHRKYYRYYFWTWIVVILVLYLIPGLVPPNIEIPKLNFEFRMDYLGHFLLFFLWTFLFVIWKWPELKEKETSALLLFISLGFVFSSTIEIIHYYLPTRTFNPMDMVSNASGFITGILFILWLTFKGYQNRIVDLLKRFD